MDFRRSILRGFVLIDVVTNIFCKNIYMKMCNSLHIYNNIEIIVSYMYLYVVVLRTTGTALQ